MNIKPEIVPPCGLYCGVCRMYQATQAGDLTTLERLARIYAHRLPELAPLSAADLLCDGCLSARRSVFCRECSIRECAQTKALQGCHECGDFPCALIDAFPVPVGKKVILRAIPTWRSHGTQEWLLAEERRYRCPECGGALFRGARSCPHCRAPVDVD